MYKSNLSWKDKAKMHHNFGQKQLKRSGVSIRFLTSGAEISSTQQHPRPRVKQSTASQPPSTGDSRALLSSSLIPSSPPRLGRSSRGDDKPPMRRALKNRRRRPGPGDYILQVEDQEELSQPARARRWLTNQPKLETRLGEEPKPSRCQRERERPRGRREEHQAEAQRCRLLERRRMRQIARLLCANNSSQPKPVGRWRDGRASEEEEDQGRRQGQADERRRGLTCSRTGEGRQNKGRRQGRKAAAFTPAPPHTRPFPLTHDGLYGGLSR